MNRKLNTKNELKIIVEEEKLHLKSNFVSLNSNEITDFPKLDESTIATWNRVATWKLSVKTSV